MKLKICLSKTALIFYSIISPFIMFGSLYNLINGIILNKNEINFYGALSMFGFILMPILLISTYRQNVCEIYPDKIKIGKEEYPASSYNFEIEQRHLALKDRPIFFLWRKTYSYFVVRYKSNNSVVLEKDLDVFQSDILKIKSALP
ncbi:hypothetical protein LUD75_09320 [Epilithonimonas sp. JDS]|uniref:hypothetical protein n=1 Tax=Epilithonimonas sp. JDS TaxID=2902797 RepID=UPI001E60A656|nr:hypothetical protein [Epilithonimonas sp. JDS]MCD9854904.1 hypothetical protein [Epilithonimonas sp. JDS]